MILVFGAAGQLGSAFCRLLGREATGLSRDQGKLDAPSSLAETLDRLAPSVVINAAAYTQVDKAEVQEPLALRINAEAPGVMAQWCAARDVPFLHFSTDYVFSGEGEKPWREEDPPAPLNAYGRTKLAGERAVSAAGGRALTFRTSWVYDAEGKNFLNTMLRLGAERETIRVVSDQHGAPTFAPHLARAAWQALQNAQKEAVFPTGIYHLCSQGETSWHGFARAIFDESRARGAKLRVQTLEAIPTSAFPTPARRPANSRMSLDKARNSLHVELPDWRESLRDCLDEKFTDLKRENMR